MKTILIINLDITMCPSMPLYNHLINYEPIDELQNKIPILSLLPNNNGIFVGLTDTILNLFSVLSKEKIHFLLQSSKVYYELNNQEQYKIINISQDSGLLDTQKSDQTITPHNWMYKSFQNYNILSYYWYCSETSMPSNLKKNNIVIQNYTENQFNEQINLHDIDDVYICLSPYIIPKRYGILSDIWLILYNFIYKEEAHIG